MVSPHDALRLLKQPRGDTRSAVRSADYMWQTLRLLKERSHHVHKRSINATGQAANSRCCSFVLYFSFRWLLVRLWNLMPNVSLFLPLSFLLCLSPDLLTEEELRELVDITGCAARIRMPECRTVPNLNVYRTITSVCNNL